jgi:hypothetical protein
MSRLAMRDAGERGVLPFQGGIALPGRSPWSTTTFVGSRAWRIVSYGFKARVGVGHPLASRIGIIPIAARRVCRQNGSREPLFRRPPAWRSARGPRAAVRSKQPRHFSGWIRFRQRKVWRWRSLPLA